MKASDENCLLATQVDPDPGDERPCISDSVSPQRDELVTILLAIIIGLFSGLLVTWFRLALSWAQVLLHGRWSLSRGPWIVFVPAAGGLIAAFMVQRFFPGVRAGAIAATRVSIHLNNGYVSLRTAIGQFLCSVLAVTAGQPLGPEDPCMHAGAGLAALLGRTLRISPGRMTRLAPVGAAAALAGFLNAPIAAVLFIAEVVIGSWTSVTEAGSVLVGAVTSTVVVRYLLGSEPLFRVPALHYGSARELGPYVLLGVTAGFAALLLDRFIRNIRTLTLGLRPWTYPLQVGVIGVVVGFIWYSGFPEVIGPGYDVIGSAMYGQLAWKMLVLLAVMKLFLSGLSFATRTPGGLIAPTLFIGAMIGCAASGLERSFIPNATASISVYVLLGMAAMFASVLRAPITSILLVAEVGGSYSIMLPSVLVVAISWVIAHRFRRESLVEALSFLDGMRLPRPQEQNPQMILRVQDAMQTPGCPVVDSHMTLRQAWREVAHRVGDPVFVRLGDAGWTVIERSLLDQLEATNDPHRRLDETVESSPIPQLYPDLPLDTTLRHLHKWPVLPVVSRANVRILEGIVTMRAVMSRYEAIDPGLQHRTNCTPGDGSRAASRERL